MAENKPELGNIPPALRDHLITYLLCD